ANTYIAAASFDRDGIRGLDIATFVPDGAVSAYLGRVQRSREDLLTGLPDQDGAVVFGAGWTLPQGTRPPSGGLLGAIFTSPAGRELQREGESRAALDAAKDLYHRIDGLNGIVRFDRGGPGMAISGVYLTEQPADVISDLRESIGVLTRAKLMNLM